MNPIQSDFSIHESQLAAFAKAMSHPARIRMVTLMLRAEAPIPCGSFVAELPLAQSTVSQHLKELVDAGIVNMARQGTSCFYQLDRSQLLNFCRSFQIAMGNPPADHH